MAHVSGHVRIVKRKRGDQWYAKYRLPSGRQVQKRLGPVWTERSRPPAGYFTRKTAQAELAAILTDARRGEIPDPSDRSGKSFGDAVAEWLRYVEDEKGRRASTVRDYRNTAESALQPEFGSEMPLEAITEARIDGYRQRLLAEGKLSRRTVQKRMVVLGGILKRAKAVKWIQEDPTEEVEKVSLSRSPEFNVLSAVQAEAVARKAPAPFSAAINVAGYTGLRAGELRALRWRDVNFAGSSIRVQRNLPTGGELGAPKSGRGRSVPLMDDAARELDALSRREQFTGPEDVVFCDEVGRMVAEDAFRKALYAAMEAAGVDRKAFPAKEGFTFHDLRHTFGTMAAQVWPLHDVQAFMGHADITTTMIYVHHVPKHDAAARFTEFVREQKGTLESVSPTMSRTAENSAQLSALSAHRRRPQHRASRLARNYETEGQQARILSGALSVRLLVRRLTCKAR
jgi:integrase